MDRVTRPYVLIFDHVLLRAYAFANLIEAFIVARDIAVEIFPRRLGDSDLNPGACRLCVINLDADKLVSVEARVQVGIASSLFASAPLMLLAADVDEQDLALAAELSVDALVPLEGGVDVLARALDAVLDGSGYMPAVPSRSTGQARPRLDLTTGQIAPNEPFPYGRDIRPEPSARAAPLAGKDAGACRLSQHLTPRPETPDIATSSSAPTAASTRLTDRQIAVLAELQGGKSNKQIARTLDLAEATVKIHVRELMRKLNVNNRTQLAIIALRGRSGPPVRLFDGSDPSSAAPHGGRGGYELHLSGQADPRHPLNLKWMP